MQKEIYVCDICGNVFSHTSFHSRRITIVNVGRTSNYWQVCRECIDGISDFINKNLKKQNGKHNGNLRGQNN